jgi:hypothetical protein
MKPLLLWKSNECYKFLCVCVCVRACVCARSRVGDDMLVRACFRVWVSVCARAPACVCSCVGLLIQYAKRRCHIVCVLFGSTLFFDIIL